MLLVIAFKVTKTFYRCLLVFYVLFMCYVCYVCYVLCVGVLLQVYQPFTSQETLCGLKAKSEATCSTVSLLRSTTKLLITGFYNCLLSSLASQYNPHFAYAKH